MLARTDPVRVYIVTDQVAFTFGGACNQLVYFRFISELSVVYYCVKLGG